MSHAKIYPELTVEYVRLKWKEMEKHVKEFNDDYSLGNALAEERRIPVTVEIEPEEEDDNDKKNIIENKEKNKNKVVKSKK